MRLDRRLDRLVPALSARERAILVLRDFKEDNQQNYRYGQSMSHFEVPEYNRLIRIMTASNLHLVPSTCCWPSTTTSSAYAWAGS